jgi:hypothetical protein
MSINLSFPRLFPKKEKKIEDKNTSLTVSKWVIEKMKYI